MSEATNAPAGADAPSHAPTGLSILDALDDADAKATAPSAEDEEQEEESSETAVEEDDEPTEDTPPEEDEEETPAEDDEAEPEPKERAEKGFVNKDAKVRLRDGTEATVLDVIKRAEESSAKAQELERKLTERPRELEQAARELTGQRQQLQQLLPLAVQALARNLPPEPNPALINDDPIQFIQDKARYEAALGELQQLRAAQMQEQQGVQQQTAQHFQEYIRTERTRLLEALPELKDPARATQFAGEFQKLATDLGFTPEEATKVYDHRLFKLAQWAMKGMKAEEAAKQTKVKVAEKVKSKPPVSAPVAAPAARTSPAERERAGTRSSLERLKRNPSSAEAAEAFLSRFD